MGDSRLQLKKIRVKGKNEKARSRLFKKMLVSGSHTYLITHSKPPIIDRRPPNIRNGRHISQIDQIQPPIKHKPPSLPMTWYKIFPSSRNKRIAVEKEENKDDEDTTQDEEPQFVVHCRFDVLFALHEIATGGGEGIESPGVEGC